MSYPFPKINKENFQKTFLKDVSLTFNFDVVKRKSLCYKDICSFYNNKFNLEDIKEKDIIEGISVNSNDNLIKFNFTYDHVSVKMTFPAYKNFSFAQKWVQFMQDYMNILSVNNVNKIILSKYNELKYKLPDEKSTVSKAMEQIFSEKLLDFMPTDGKVFKKESENFSDLARWEKRIVFDDSEDSKTRAIIEYGFCKSTENKDEGVLTMKTIIESLNDAKSVSDVDCISSEYNDYIDRAFQWCISKNVLTKMRAK